MKKLFIFAAMAAMATLASCSKEPATNGVEVGPGEKAEITIALTSPQSRLANDQSVDADNKINDLIVFVTRGGNTFDVSPIYFSASDLTALPTANKLVLQATTAAARVLIITNTGDLATGPFQNVTNMTELAKVTKKIGPTTEASTCKAGNVWMSGETSTLIPNDHSDGTKCKKGTIALEYIPAKVIVYTVNNMKNYANGNTTLQGVSLFNAGQWSGFVKDATKGYCVTPATGEQTPFFANGIDIVKFPTPTFGYINNPGAGNVEINALYHNTVGFPLTSPADTKTAVTDAHAFYIFPNALDATTKTWVSVYGTQKEPAIAPATGTVDTQKFWSLPFNGTDITENVTSGKKYIITITMNGNANLPGGNIEPGVETEDSELEITVDTPVWTVVPINKTFN